MSSWLFRPAARFQGLPAHGFGAFEVRDREERRQAIVEAFHPGLKLLGEDLLERLGDPALHAHLPRLDWPKGYQPFCTWLALSRQAHGYQGHAQLNVGVHRDHVGLRLGWDASADLFGRFEFLCRHGHLGDAMADLAEAEAFVFRVYAAAPWPEGSRLVFASPSDWRGAFDEVRRRGVWFELGIRLELPADLERVTRPDLGEEAGRVFTALLPLHARITGAVGEGA
ncbi:MAG TPA: DUF1054 family protein [Candidatus Polarisedimenticolaceae bacterium]|nr:DUF1054 family protein [Candidatus Polarisedimenticolaceae bacterium]